MSIREKKRNEETYIVDIANLNLHLLLLPLQYKIN